VFNNKMKEYNIVKHIVKKEKKSVPVSVSTLAVNYLSLGSELQLVSLNHRKQCSPNQRLGHVS